MKYIIDNDLHIHTKLSSCSQDEEQTPERILQYAKENGLKTICVTDHFWDENVPGVSAWYAPQNYASISRSLPLPKDDKICFLFGCETDLDKFLTLGIAKETIDKFDFIIIPTTHLHMEDRFTLSEEEAATIEGRAKAWVTRLDAVLDMDLPFHKIGIAHLVTNGIYHYTHEGHLKAISLIPDEDLIRVFTKAAKVGVGIEINSYDMEFADEDAEIILRPLKIAKKCGCKFYLGTDAHHPDKFENAKEIFARAIDMLDLEESDKFILK